MPNTHRPFIFVLRTMCLCLFSLCIFYRYNNMNLICPIEQRVCVSEWTSLCTLNLNLFGCAFWLMRCDSCSFALCLFLGTHFIRGMNLHSTVVELHLTQLNRHAKILPHQMCHKSVSNESVWLIKTDVIFKAQKSHTK